MDARRAQPSLVDRMLRPLHRWVWRDAGRRARKLLAFAETEAAGGRDLARAAELTGDAILRRLYLRHARDEQKHAEIFIARGRALLGEGAGRRGADLDWLAPGERGGELRVEDESDASLLAFLHVSEKAAAGRFALYREVLEVDRTTADVFATVLRDEEFHMNYTRTQLARVAPRGRALWRTRAGRLWKGYLRLAMMVAGVLGGAVLLAQYFVILPIFALFAKRSERHEKLGYSPRKERPLGSQY